MRTMAAMAALLALAATGGCKTAADELTITDAWVRLPAVPRQPAALYFTIRGGAVDDTLIGVSADNAIRAEMHRTMKAPDGMAAMTPLAEVTVPAHATLKFAPGGLHVMLFDVNPAIKPPRVMPINFTFRSAAHYTISATTRSAGG